MASAQVTPKIIHYCWFGGAEMPELAHKCIASWRKFLPGYEIREWNETNFDVGIIPYVQEAYQAKKYAFVSDYARFWIIYHYGGVYFDTDVELIKSIDDLVSGGKGFMGIEKNSTVDADGNRSASGVNPGLGFGAPAGLDLLRELLETYAGTSFRNSDNTLNLKTIVNYTTELLIEKGLKHTTGIQEVAGVKIYPEDYFCPMDPTTGITDITKNSVSIHHYSCSWHDHMTLRFQLHLLKNRLIKIFGPKFVMAVAKVLRGNKKQ